MKENLEGFAVGGLKAPPSRLQEKCHREDFARRAVDLTRCAGINIEFRSPSEGRQHMLGEVEVRIQLLCINRSRSLVSSQFFTWPHQLDRRAHHGFWTKQPA